MMLDGLGEWPLILLARESRHSTNYPARAFPKLDPKCESAGWLESPTSGRS